MISEPDTPLLIRARAAYNQVISDPQAFEPQAVRLVAEARAVGDVEALCVALRAAAWAKRIRLDHDLAEATLDESITLAKRHNLTIALGEALISRGALKHERGRLAAARRDFESAADFVSGDARAEVTFQLATLHHNAGRMAQAASGYAEVLESGEARETLRAKAGNNLAVILSLRGENDAAASTFTSALASAAEVGPAMTALVTESRAWSLVLGGQVGQGMMEFERAMGLWRDVGLPLGDLYAEYADALESLRLIPEAVERAQQAADMFVAQGVNLMAAEAKLRVARLKLLAGEHEEALAAARQAQIELSRQRRTVWAARAALVTVEAGFQAEGPRPAQLRATQRAVLALRDGGLFSIAVDGYLVGGRIARALDQPRHAADLWCQAHQLSQGSSMLVRLKGKLAASLAAELQGQTHLVRKYTRSGLDDLARHRAAIASTELKALASGHGEELGRIGLAARVGTQPAIKVLEWMERTRAAALSQTDVHESQEVGDDLGELRAVQAELVAARRETGKEPPSLRARLAAAEQRIRRATWTAEATGAVPGSALPMPDLRRALGEQVLVEYDVLDGDLIAAVLDARRTKLVRLGPFDRLRSELDSLLFGLRYLAGNPTATAAPAMADVARAGLGRLRELLLAPLRLAEHPGLVVVPVKELHQVPWAALHTRPVALAPSASMWARSSRADPPPNTRVVLAAGPELPGAAHEVTELARHLDEATVLAPPDSTVESVTKALDEASLAHLACHCFVRSDNPTFSSLLLSDGYLTVHELDQRADVPHRVILAACESGKDVTYEGNEVLGFVSTLMGKGSAGVIASSVVVPDQDVLPLMRAVHQEVAKGATLAQALHSAQSVADSEDPRSMVAALAFNAFGAA